MIATWNGFRQQLTRLLDGEDISQTTITPLTLDQIISLGERRIYREVMSRWNETSFNNVICSNNLAPIPSDFEQPSQISVGTSSLEPVTEDFIGDNLTLSRTRYIAVAGPNFTFAGPVADGTILQGRYYCRLPDLSASTLPTNNLFLKEPDLFIFACLAEAAPFFEQDARIPLWEARYTAIRNTINEAHQRAAFSGRLMRRPSAGGFRPIPQFGGATTLVGNYATSWAAGYA